MMRNARRSADKQAERAAKQNTYHSHRRGTTPTHPKAATAASSRRATTPTPPKVATATAAHRDYTRSPAARQHSQSHREVTIRQRDHRHAQHDAEWGHPPPNHRHHAGPYQHGDHPAQRSRTPTTGDRRDQRSRTPVGAPPKGVNHHVPTHSNAVGAPRARLTVRPGVSITTNANDGHRTTTTAVAGQHVTVRTALAPPLVTPSFNATAPPCTAGLPLFGGTGTAPLEQLAPPTTPTAKKAPTQAVPAPLVTTPTPKLPSTAPPTWPEQWLTRLGDDRQLNRNRHATAAPSTPEPHPPPPNNTDADNIVNLDESPMATTSPVPTDEAADTPSGTYQ